jgi:hypothetical protein
MAEVVSCCRVFLSVDWKTVNDRLRDPSPMVHGYRITIINGCSAALSIAGQARVQRPLRDSSIRLLRRCCILFP